MLLPLVRDIHLAHTSLPVQIPHLLTRYLSSRTILLYLRSFFRRFIHSLFCSRFVCLGGMDSSDTIPYRPAILTGVRRWAFFYTLPPVTSADACPLRTLPVCITFRLPALPVMLAGTGTPVATPACLVGRAVEPPPLHVYAYTICATATSSPFGDRRHSLPLLIRHAGWFSYFRPVPAWNISPRQTPPPLISPLFRRRTGLPDVCCCSTRYSRYAHHHAYFLSVRVRPVWTFAVVYLGLPVTTIPARFHSSVTIPARLLRLDVGFLLAGMVLADYLDVFVR